VTLVGVAGRSLTDACGERAVREAVLRFGDAIEAEAEEVLEAFECDGR